MSAILAQRAFSVIHALFVCFLLTGFAVGAKRSDHETLFVFGDSYADTGNRDKYDPAFNTPWQAPYGITWPCYPSGRFSDGGVFTDFFAYSLNLHSPVPYRVLQRIAQTCEEGLSVLTSFGGGINFAFGGSGVFQTFGPGYPKVNDQIKELNSLVSKGLLSRETLESSILLMVIAGNDYTVFLETHSENELATFIPKVVDRIITSVEALYNMGFKTLAVTNLEPVGCLPSITQGSNYTTCNITANSLVSIPHNLLLEARLCSLQSEYVDATFTLLDLYASFEAVLRETNLALRPCCEGIGGSNCANKDDDGRLLYEVCSTPEATLFWDNSHPTNAGWKAIFQALTSSWNWHQL